jgi:predicted pyridoxine 5'-phosphate oxidase superfamily flavin-nucleotide-binding protein
MVNHYRERLVTLAADTPGERASLIALSADELLTATEGMALASSDEDGSASLSSSTSTDRADIDDVEYVLNTVNAAGFEDVDALVDASADVLRERLHIAEKEGLSGAARRYREEIAALTGEAPDDVVALAPEPENQNPGGSR